jgi:cytochrome P450 family 150 subfamily A5
VKDHFRMARRTVTLGGVDIPAGTSVMLLIGAINRHPRTFDDADAMRFDRRNLYEHVAFARGGHTCLGQQLACIEMRTSIERLLDRTTEIGISAQHHGPPGRPRPRLRAVEPVPRPHGPAPDVRRTGLTVAPAA